MQPELLTMKKTIATYLKNENKTLSQLLVKCSRLKTWNQYLKDCLPEENTLLEHCQIVGLDKTSLIVIADNPHWVARFRFFIPDLIQQLKKHEDLEDIRAICCKVKPPHYRPSRKLKRQPLLISEQTAQIMEETAGKIKNGKLKEILLRMTKRTSDNTFSATEKK